MSPNKPTKYFHSSLTWSSRKLPIMVGWLPTHTDPFSVEKKDLTEAMALLLDSLIVKFVLWKRLRAQKQNNGR